MPSVALFTVSCFVCFGLVAATTMILGTLAQKQIARAGGQLRGQLGALAATWYWRWLPPAFVGMMVASKLTGMTGASGGHEFDAAFTAKDLPAAKTASAAS